MKKFLTVLIAGIIITACSTTNELIYSRKAADFTPKKYSNIGVVAILKSNEARIDVEIAVADALRAKGYKATVTWDIWPFANKKEMMKEYGIEGEKLKEMIRQRVAAQKMDALLIIALFDARKETRYVPGSSVSVGVGFSTGAYPVYGYPYYSYFGYAYEIESDPGYYVDASTYFTESNLYDIASEKLIWSGQMSTKMESDLETEASKYGQVLTKGMFDAGVLTK